MNFRQESGPGSDRLSAVDGRNQGMLPVTGRGALTCGLESKLCNNHLRQESGKSFQHLQAAILKFERLCL